MNKQALEVLEICLRITESKRAICFFDFTAHCEYVEVSIRRFDDYTISHPKWGHFISWGDTDSSTQINLGDSDKFELVINKLKEFENIVSVDPSEEEVLSEEMLRVSSI